MSLSKRAKLAIAGIVIIASLVGIVYAVSQLTIAQTGNVVTGGPISITTLNLVTSNSTTISCSAVPSASATCSPTTLTVGGAVSSESVSETYTITASGSGTMTVVATGACYTFSGTFATTTVFGTSFTVIATASTPGSSCSVSIAIS